MAGETEYPPEAINALPPQFAFNAPYPNPARSALTVDVSLPESAELSVTVNTLQDETVDVIFGPGASLDAGLHAFRWEVVPELPDGIYQVNVEANYDSRATDDSTRTVVVLRDDPVYQPLGQTGSDGAVTLADPNIFDQLQWDGTVLARTPDGLAVSMMTASRRVLIEVRDPDTGRAQTYERDILESTNEIELTWPPSS
jgi:hypothetical protein